MDVIEVEVVLRKFNGETQNRYDRETLYKQTLPVESFDLRAVIAVINSLKKGE